MDGRPMWLVVVIVSLYRKIHGVFSQAFFAYSRDHGRGLRATMLRIVLA